MASPKGGSPMTSCQCSTGDLAGEQDAAAGIAVVSD